MKQTLNFLVMLVMVATVFSCKKKDPEPLPVAEFTFTPNTGRSPITVTFTNTSLNADTYAWDFGGGAPASTEKNPVVNFTTGGTFVITLTATGAGGTTKVTKNITLLRPFTVAEKIVGKYKFTSIIETVGTTNTNFLQPCNADDTLDFLVTGNLVTTYLGLACNTNEPVSDTVPYTISADGTKVILDLTNNLDIIELTTTVLKLRLNLPQSVVVYSFARI